ncbi:hypothetical protein [Microvirga alba]|uniref:Uncharacterized protein n=1 Tax=Microvirga alba TaxID=2791025 RepID=A0A931FPE9_9HYPH|nr:hypothetical protein [Microvirga alba]MBF9234680.1 hypothetical protein [Microvirga alba]
MARQPRQLARQGAAADLPNRAAVDAYAGPAGEVISDGQRLRLQDGSTPGGLPVAMMGDVQITRVAMVDSNRVGQPKDGLVALTVTLTAPRTYTLPAANAVPAGTAIRVFDEVGAINGSNTLSVARSGTNTINGGTGSVVMSRAYNTVAFYSDGTSKWTYDPISLAPPVAPAGSLPQGHLFGLKVSRPSATSIAIAAGSCASDDSTPATLNLAAFTKNFVAWTAGTTGGLLDAAASSGWWHLFVIGKADGTTDVYGSKSLTPTLPSGYVSKRRIFSVFYDGSAIRDFVHTPSGWVLWASPTLDLSTTAGTTRALTALFVPPGFQTEAQIRVQISAPVSVVSSVSVGSPDVADVAPSFANVGYDFVNYNGGTNDQFTRVTVLTDNQSRIAYRADQANTGFKLSTLGYREMAGRF